MIQFIFFMAPTVFLINGLTKHNWLEAFFFALAVAVGLTPEMLPMIVSVCLSKGAMLMSRKKVIVKRLNSIQNFGAMDVLCTDKTGTLTMDHVILEQHCDVVQKEDDEVLRDAYLVSHFQTGLRNVLDRAVLQHKEVQNVVSFSDYLKVDEIPFDFSRRLMSVVVRFAERGIPASHKRCAGRNFQTLHSIRVGRRYHADGPCAHSRFERRVRTFECGRVPRACAYIQGCREEDGLF